MGEGSRWEREQLLRYRACRETVVLGSGHARSPHRSGQCYIPWRTVALPVHRTRPLPLATGLLCHQGVLSSARGGATRGVRGALSVGSLCDLTCNATPAGRLSGTPKMRSVAAFDTVPFGNAGHVRRRSELLLPTPRVSADRAVGPLSGGAQTHAVMAHSTSAPQCGGLAPSMRAGHVQHGRRAVPIFWLQLRLPQRDSDRPTPLAA